MENYYQVLGIEPSATNEQITKAFWKKAKLYHPDVTDNNQFAEELFKRVTAAKECLLNPEERLRHDQLFGLKEGAAVRSAKKRVDLGTLFVLLIAAGIAGAVLGYFAKRPKLA